MEGAALATAVAERVAVLEEGPGVEMEGEVMALGVVVKAAWAA